jgi:hypothetical protein
MAANQTSGGARPPREGGALCQGIIYCGCGRHMGVHYHEGRAYYACRARHDQQATPDCQHASAATVDDAVTKALFTAIAPEELKLAIAAAGEVTARRERATRAAELAAERARYQADRAERAFLACEPENRLVARSLETRWETKLRELAEAEAELAEQTKPAPEPSREQLEALARDVPALWAADSTSEKDRKRLLRALVADVTITSQPQSSDVAVGIRWRTGAAEQHTIKRPPSINDTTRTAPATIALITRLASQHTNTEIAAELNAEGIRTGKGLPFTDHAVRHIRRAHDIPATRPPHDDRLTVNEIAERLGVSPGVIYDWISHDKLAADRDRANRLRIAYGPAIDQECRERIANSRHIAETKIAATGGAV